MTVPGQRADSQLPIIPPPSICHRFCGKPWHPPSCKDAENAGICYEAGSSGPRKSLFGWAWRRGACEMLVACAPDQLEVYSGLQDFVLRLIEDDASVASSSAAPEAFCVARGHHGRACDFWT